MTDSIRSLQDDAADLLADPEISPFDRGSAANRLIERINAHSEDQGFSARDESVKGLDSLRRSLQAVVRSSIHGPKAKDRLHYADSQERAASHIFEGFVPLESFFDSVPMPSRDTLRAWNTGCVPRNNWNPESRRYDGERNKASLRLPMPVDGWVGPDGRSRLYEPHVRLGDEDTITAIAVQYAGKQYGFLVNRVRVGFIVPPDQAEGLVLRTTNGVQEIVPAAAPQEGDVAFGDGRWINEGEWPLMTDAAKQFLAKRNVKPRQKWEIKAIRPFSTKAEAYEYLIDARNAWRQAQESATAAAMTPAVEDLLAEDVHDSPDEEMPGHVQPLDLDA